MRTSILNLVFFLLSFCLFGQNENPYKEFGYEAPIMPENEESRNHLNQFIIFNPDTSSSIAFLTVNVLTRTATYLNKSGLIVNRSLFSPYSVSRWLTVDPKGQFTSPYIGMGNNPISAVDPDGGWIKYNGTRQERRELRQMYREMRHNSDDFRRDFNKLRFSFKRHDIEAVADKTNITGYAANQEKFFSNPHSPEAMESQIYNLKVKVMYSGVSGVIETSKSGRTTTFIALEYHKSNPNAPAPTSKTGLLPTLAHEFNHSYNHHFGLPILDFEAAAVDYQNKIMLQVGKSTGVKYDFRKNYEDH
jgi:hypothetical protein